MPMLECAYVTRESFATKRRPTYFFDPDMVPPPPMEQGQRTSRPPVSRREPPTRRHRERLDALAARATDLLVRQAQIKLDLSTERYLRLVRELRGAR